MAWKLTPLRGAVEPVILGQNAIVFGRHPENAVVLDDDMCSRKHCQITLDSKEGYVVKDLGSRNGTKVNDQRIPGPTTLRLGDVLRVGGHEFLVERAEPDVSSADSSVMGAVIDTSIERSIFTTDPHEASAAISTDSRQPSNSPDIKRADVDLPWQEQLLSMLETLPPKLPEPERVSIIDAGGQPSSALLGSSDGPNAVRLLLQVASKTRATDIHIEPKPEIFHVRMRIDGQMLAILELPRRVGELFFGLVKTACQIRSAGREAMQEGHFSATFPDRRVDFRVSFTPSVHGQKLVIRVLDSRDIPRSLEEMGLLMYMADRVERVCRQDSGLLLVCGPTGSGKTTTLYNALRRVDRETRNVITIEDPVEYQLEGVTQIPVDEDKGNSFGSMLRSVLRQDPDVILVGEVRDEETARTAMQAAMTGHVVFTTLHAKDSVTAVFRLLDLKVEPYLVANALDLVLAQRLVRVLCETCKREMPITSSISSRLGKHLQSKNFMFGPTGCVKCLNTGYRGRRALFELLEFTDELRDVVLHNPSIASMKKVIESGLFTTLPQFGWRIVAEGATSLEEVDHVAGLG